MKTLIQTLFFFLLVTQICFAQPGWISQSQQTSKALSGVCFTNENNGWAVVGGDAINAPSSFMKTTDGGLTWIRQSTGVQCNLSDISFANDLVGITVGQMGNILRTTNGGVNWVQQSSGTTLSLNSISILNSNNVWVVGGGEDIWAQDNSIILHSSNGGQYWIQQASSNLKSLFGVSFMHPNSGIAVGKDGTILNTTNGGITWISQNSGTTRSLFGTGFFNTNVAIAVGDSGTILRTTNGGNTWITQSNVTPNKLEGLAILDSLSGWVSGENGTILKTTDGGISWLNVLSGTCLPLRGIYFIDSSHGIAVGGFTGRHGSLDAGIILSTSDGGITWESQTGIGTLLTDISFFDANVGIAMGYGYMGDGPLLRTTNGGKNWTIQDLSGNGYFLGSDAYCINQWTGYIVSFRGIRKTTDAGLTWRDQTIDSITIQGISFSDENTGTMVGYYSPGGVCGTGVIMRTTDSGNFWNYQTSPTELPLTDVCFVDTDHGWIVGSTSTCSQNGGVILNTTDGGATWVEQWNSPENILMDVCFTDINNGWAVGNSWNQFSTILNTTNGGANWTQIIDSTKQVWGVYFTDVNNGWIVGGISDSLGSSYILHTEDGGTTWTQQESGTGYMLSSVHFIDANTGWVVGGGGTILHTTNGGVTFVEEEQTSEVPTEFLLSQNWPNPFNPSTKIKYSIPQSSQVQIKVFDVLGNEIETLVNEEKPAGTYEITWNAANLPSGVYFYQLKAESFIETKKMTLMK